MAKHNFNTKSNEGLEAFCQHCPDPEQVTLALQELGFHLTFQMEPVVYRYGSTPPLPAQFHYSDGANNELIYLAGHDSGTEDDLPLPRHASRFWLYLGKDIERFHLVSQALAIQFHLSWKPIAAASTAQGVA